MRTEAYHWKELLSTVLCAIGGVALVFSGDMVGIGSGLALVGLSIAALILTQWWQYAIDLPIGKKIIAYIPVIVGGIVVFVAFFMINLFFGAIAEALKD